MSNYPAASGSSPITSDGDPNDHDVQSDPAHDDETGGDWTSEGGATDDGPATDQDTEPPGNGMPDGGAPAE
jgi:hypothetical protein